MIRYSLKCAAGHVFDSWFRDSAAFDALAAANRVTCAVCGETRVRKAVMAPAVTAQDRAAPGPERAVPAGQDSAAPAPQDRAAPKAPPADGPVPMLSGPAGPVEQALARLRVFLKEKADYVGPGFADEARRIHLGEADERTIWGEATADEARELREEGVPVAPIPLLSRRDD